MNRKSITPRSTGFSLVELMLALALGIVVVTGIVQLFVGNSRTYEVLNGQARMQENARFALEFISRAARSAGFFGCSTDRTNYVNGLGGEWENIPDREWDITQPIQAEDDWVLFRGMRGDGHRLTQVLQPDGDPRIATPGGDPDFEIGDVVILANCEQGAVFRVDGLADLGGDVWQVSHHPGAGGLCMGSVYTAVGNAQCVTGNAEPWVAYSLSLLNRSYGVDAVVGALQNTRFFIGADPDGNEALFQQVNDDLPVELVGGVEALDVLFGLDTAPDPDQGPRARQYVTYADLPDPNDLSDVVALRVNLTVNSIDPVTEDGEPLRRIVGKTIVLRNANPEA